MLSRRKFLALGAGLAASLAATIGLASQPVGAATVTPRCACGDDHLPCPCGCDTVELGQDVTRLARRDPDLRLDGEPFWPGDREGGMDTEYHPEWVWREQPIPPYPYFGWYSTPLAGRNVTITSNTTNVSPVVFDVWNGTAREQSE